MLSDQDIFNRYQQKQAEFEKKSEVTLIGHSLFDMWGDLPQGTPSLMGKTVANLGISGVSTRQYLDVIAAQGAIQHLGETVFFFLGVNDIVKEPQYSPQQVLDWLQQIIDNIRPLAPSNVRYFLLEATPVNEDQIKTVTNAQIAVLNDYLAHHCPNELTFIPTQQAFRNDQGWLADSLSSDGLHFSAKGYDTLAQLLLPHLTR
ncbi:SGNH/GDSL hydrolase family protein [Rodentibacter myodis]|uniref:Acylneuraminate cytidylyltransferase n=1 Tax=Rodentibacter myodis TaxID=1907939 RepID=A0A1V3JU63_9PAST|nr:SGNH/GDSL hydrolase family protein [Rodentibacter myodis]OOF60260.1 acylneuraminate cytidylyltransferase [Rodentibacter myodis]